MKTIFNQRVEYCLFRKSTPRIALTLTRDKNASVDEARDYHTSTTLNRPPHFRDASAQPIDVTRGGETSALRVVLDRSREASFLLGAYSGRLAGWAGVSLLFVAPALSPHPGLGVKRANVRAKALGETRGKSSPLPAIRCPFFREAGSRWKCPSRWLLLSLDDRELFVIFRLSCAGAGDALPALRVPASWVCRGSGSCWSAPGGRSARRRWRGRSSPWVSLPRRRGWAGGDAPALHPLSAALGAERVLVE